MVLYMKTTYPVFGTRKQGYRIAVPSKAKMADEYEITHYPLGGCVVLPENALVYATVPACSQDADERR